jgi:ABC-2 type transport system permease protein
MEKLKLIIYREFLSKVRNRSFIILTFLSPFLVIGMGTLIFYLTKINDQTAKNIAIVDESELEIVAEFIDTETVKYIDLTLLGVDETKKQVEKGNYSGLLYVPKIASDLQKLSKSITYFCEDSPGIMMLESFEKKVANKLKHHKLSQLGIDEEMIKSANYHVEISHANFSGNSSSKLGNGLRIGMGMGAGYLVMMFIIVYGNSVMRSVIEEKTNRIIEIIISSVKPFQLMLGKIIGNASAGLLQFVVWGVLIIVFGGIASFAFGVDFGAASNLQTIQGQMNTQELEQINSATALMGELFSLPLVTMFFLFVFYFIGGFFLYSSIYAAIGAAVDSETDTQQFMLPVMLPLMLAVYVGFASVISDPHGPVAVVFSMIPFTSSIVMLMRIPFGVPWWQLTISMLSLIATFVFMVWFSAKIYRVGILMYGKKPSYKDLYKWLKY